MLAYVIWAYYVAFPLYHVLLQEIQMLGKGHKVQVITIT